MAREMQGRLKSGDRVAVIAPAGVVNREMVEEGIKVLEKWGLRVERGAHLYGRRGSFSGSDEERLADLQNAMDDEGVRAIFCARGGFGVTRIIDRIDFRKYALSPKWITGYSDITALQLWLGFSEGIPSVHGEMVQKLGSKERSPETSSSLFELLFNGANSHRWSSDFKRAGTARGILAGGNLSMICTLAGTGAREWLSGKILFIEDTGEYLYRIDRMMTQLRLSGILSSISGLIIGGLSEIPDTAIAYGMSAEEIILDSVSGYDYPVACGFPAGHIHDNRALCMGAEYLFKAGEGSSSLEMV